MAKRMWLGLSGLAWLMIAAACGDGSGARPKDMGEVCAQTGEAFCHRAEQCSTGSYSYTQCANDFMKGCCLDKGTCSKPLRETITGADVAHCCDALEVMSCTDAAQGLLPPACLGM